MATPIAIAVSLVHKSRTARACLAAAPLDCYASLEPDPASILQGGEMIYYEGLAHARRKMSYLVGRYTAKQAVSAYLGVRPDALELVPGFFGQPVVTASAVQPPAVSLSHDSRTAVAIAFPEAYLIGLDIETLDSCGAGAVESVLSEREIRAATVGPFAAPVMRTVFWTAREALGKAIRCGCLVEPAVLEVSESAASKAVGEGGIRSVFANFPAFGCDSWVLDDQVVSVVTPRDVRNSLSESALRAALRLPREPLSRVVGG